LADGRGCDHGGLGAGRYAPASATRGARKPRRRPEARRRLGDAIRPAQVVIHLAGTLQPKGGNSYEFANVDTTERVAQGVREGSVARVVFLSYVGADRRSPNAYLRSKGEAERLLEASGAPVTIFRCVHIYGPPGSPGPTARAFLAKGRAPVSVPGTGGQRIAPLYIGDVAEAVESAALDPETATGTFELAGPDEMTIDEFVRALNGGEVRLVHLPPVVARGLAHVVPSLTPALMELLLRDNVPVEDSAPVAKRFGVDLHRFGDVWRPPRR
jgi:uncharacterized protein YbjT (DUF2867 family)